MTEQQQRKRTPMWISVLSALIIAVGWLVFESGLLDRFAPSGADASSAAGGRLDELRVAPEGSADGYSRDRFEHWIAAPQAGRNCNTREAVLRRDGDGVRTDGACRATAGTWRSAYTGRTVTDASDVDVDHLVPLADAWRSGASKWTDEQREHFANDLSLPQLVAVDATSNRAKGDKDPSEWRPAEAAWCEYATDWVAVKHAYRLTVTTAEKSALAEMLTTC